MSIIIIILILYSANLQEWLSDSKGRDEFAIRVADRTEIYWNDIALSTPVLDYDGGDETKSQDKTWCEMNVDWSPLGNYFVTFHKQGLLLWGGKEYKRLIRLAHDNVEKLLFSPDEHYILTWNGCTDKTALDSIILWNIRTGVAIHKFAYPNNDLLNNNNNNNNIKTNSNRLWPVYKWSYDSKYLAVLGRNCIGVYSLPSVTLLDEKVIGIPGVKDFEWSPNQNVIAYWLPEVNNKPAQINMINIPTKTILQSGSSTRAIDMELFWHPQGTYFLAKITRTNKSKKAKTTSLQIYYMNLKDIPNEVIDIQDRIVDLSWEPHGNRLALILSKVNTQNTNTVTIYKMTEDTSRHCNLFFSMDKKTCNKIFWSPQGNYMVLAGFGSMNGALEFFESDEKRSNKQSEHFQCNDIRWDPSGRIVASLATIPMFSDEKIERSALENGYILWTFQGKEMYRSIGKKFYEFVWRPRMKSLLTEEHRKDIINNLKQFIDKYKEIDQREKKQKVYNDAVAELKQLDEFREYMKRKHQFFEQHKKEVYSLYEGTVNPYTIAFTTIEEQVSIPIGAPVEEIESK